MVDTFFPEEYLFTGIECDIGEIVNIQIIYDTEYEVPTQLLIDYY